MGNLAAPRRPVAGDAAQDPPPFPEDKRKLPADAFEIQKKLLDR